MTDDERAKRARDLSNACGDLLRGHGPGIQGAVVADLLATYIATHVGETAEDTENIRQHQLAGVLQAAGAMVALRDKFFGAQIPAGATRQ